MVGAKERARVTVSAIVADAGIPPGEAAEEAAGSGSRSPAGEGRELASGEFEASSRRRGEGEGREA